MGAKFPPNYFFVKTAGVGWGHRRPGAALAGVVDVSAVAYLAEADHADVAVVAVAPAAGVAGVAKSKQQTLVSRLGFEGAVYTADHLAFE